MQDHQIESGIGDAKLRLFQVGDTESLRRLTVQAFSGVSLEHNIEQCLGGELNGHDWRWRKARHIDADIAANATGIFVAESAGLVVGYVTTRIDLEAGQGRIPNLAVAESFRGKGLGRRLIEHALNYFRSQGLQYAVIETMAQNSIGQYLYPECGFQEVARQFHYARRL